MANNKQAKEGAEFITKLGLNPDDYPEIMERLMKRTMRYYLGLYLNQDKNPQEKMDLWKIVDLLACDK